MGLKELRDEIKRLIRLDDKNNPHTTLKLQLKAIKQTAEAYQEFIDKVSERTPMALIVSHGLEPYQDLKEDGKLLQEIKKLLEVD